MKNGRAKGVAYIDRTTKQEVEVYATRRGRCSLLH